MDSIPNQYASSKTYSINTFEQTASILTDLTTDVDLRLLDFVENNQYLKLLKDDINSDNDSAQFALKRVHLVALKLGPEITKEYLIPFLTEIQKSIDVRILDSVCDSWYSLSKVYEDEENLLLIFKGLEYLLSQDGHIIREKAINTVIHLVDDIEKKEQRPKGSGVEIVTTIILPMIQKFVENDWFPAPTSACNLIPKLYKYASEKSQNELRQQFQILCDSDFLTVKLAAARNLKVLLPLVQLEHAISMFWLVLKNMSIDNEEKIRMQAVETSLVFAKQCSKEQNLNYNIPILVGASEDSSWKVRQYLGVNFLKVYETFEESEVREHLFNSHVNLLKDHNVIVMTSTNQAFSSWSGILSQELIEEYVPVLDDLARKSPKDIRKTICKTMALFAMKLKKKDVLEILKPTMEHLMGDEFIEVRLCVIENIHMICDREDYYGTIGEKLKESIEMSIQSPVWRNRLVIAEQLTSFFSHFGPTIFEQNFIEVLFKLLLDDVWKVRNAVLSSLEKICIECGSIWAVKFILNEFILMYLTPGQSKYSRNHKITMAIKITIIQSLVAVAKSIDVENTIEHILPLLMMSMTDSISNIRLAAVNSLANLFVIYKNEKPELFLQAKCALIKLCQDTDIDVKYFSKKALETYEESFRDSIVI